MVGVYTITVAHVSVLVPSIKKECEKMVEIEDVILGAFVFAGLATVLLYMLTNPGGFIPFNLQEVAAGSVVVFALSKISFLSSL